MNNYNFHFAESYQGYWNISQIGRKIPGKLYLEKHSIRLELFWNNVTHRNQRIIPSATGYAYTEIDNKKLCYYFVLRVLEFISVSWFGKHQSQYKLDVNHFFMSDVPRFSTNRILNCCIRTNLMDKWVWDYTQNSYSNLWPFKENDGIEMKYQANPSLSLYESVLYKLYIKFGNEAHTPDATGFSMSTHSFLNLRLKKQLSFYDANGFTVLKGSIIAKSSVPSFTWKEKRERLLKDYTVSNDDKLELESDKTFPSPSTAADFCIGSSNNGWLVWKDKEGQTLDSVYRKQLE